MGTYRGSDSSRELQAEHSLRDEIERQQSLENELLAVRAALENVRSNLGAKAESVPHRSAPPALPASSLADSYRSLHSGLGGGTPSAAPSSCRPGIEEYYITRLKKVLGEDKIQVYNLFQSPGRSIEEAFGSILMSGSGSGDGRVPWIVTDDHWTYDLHKSHFHNLLQICTQEGKMRNVNVFMLMDKDRKDSAVDGKKDVALYAVCGLQPLLPCRPFRRHAGVPKPYYFLRPPLPHC